MQKLVEGASFYLKCSIYAFRFATLIAFLSAATRCCGFSLRLSQDVNRGFTETNSRRSF